MPKMDNVEQIAYDLGTAHWAITQKAFDSIAAIISDPNAIPKMDKDSNAVLLLNSGYGIDGTWYAKKKGNLGILEVHGPIIPYRTWYEGFLGFTSIESLNADLDVLEKDSQIENVVLTFDTPGGVVDGISEFADRLKSFSKPLYSHVLGDAASAGYWLASQGQKITGVNTSRAGSIGVVTTIVDFKDAYEKKGVKQFDVVSSQSPRKRTDLTTEEGRTELQAVLDGIADVFIDNVAAGRNVDREKVLTDFGQGGMFVAKDAVSRGLIDQVVSTSDLIGSFKNTSKSFFMGNAQSKEEKEIMSEEVKTEKVETPVASVDTTAIAKAERDRIMSIEKIKQDYESMHPEVAKAVGEKIDSIKFDPTVTAERAELEASKIANATFSAIVSNTRDAGNKLAEQVSTLPNVEDKEEKVGNTPAKADGQKVSRIAGGIKTYLRKE